MRERSVAEEEGRVVWGKAGGVEGEGGHSCEGWAQERSWRGVPQYVAEGG